MDYIDIVFDGPPGPQPGRFVEVESPAGASVNVGTWIKREGGYWALRIPSGAFITYPQKEPGEVAEDVSRLQFENERLRAAMEDIRQEAFREGCRMPHIKRVIALRISDGQSQKSES